MLHINSVFLQVLLSSSINHDLLSRVPCFLIFIRLEMCEIDEMIKGERKNISGQLHITEGFVFPDVSVLKTKKKVMAFEVNDLEQFRACANLSARAHNFDTVVFVKPESSDNSSSTTTTTAVWSKRRHTKELTAVPEGAMADVTEDHHLIELLAKRYRSTYFSAFRVRTTLVIHTWFFYT